MQITIGLTADKAKVLDDLRAPSTMTDPVQAQCDESIRAILAEYLDTHAADQPIGVTATITCNYTPV